MEFGRLFLDTKKEDDESLNGNSRTLNWISYEDGFFLFAKAHNLQLLLQKFGVFFFFKRSLSFKSGQLIILERFPVKHLI